MTTVIPESKAGGARRRPMSPEAAFSRARDFLDNRFVYVVISPRAKGLSVGVNVNPDRQCNYQCVYCEVDRSSPETAATLDTRQMAAELFKTLQWIRNGGLAALPGYREFPAELLQLRHVTLSGDGEPTLSPDFVEVVQSVVHIRALGNLPFFKIVLVTNGTGLALPAVQYGLRFLTRQDEIWIKLDGGTPGYLEEVNGTPVPLERILENIVWLGRQRPVVIQSLFLVHNGQQPPLEEIDAYIRRLRDLKEAGAQISMVQVYSATRPGPKSNFGHLPLRSLSFIARRVKGEAGLPAEVF